MKKPIHIMVIIILLLLTFFLYNKKLGSIPLLILSIYLFGYGWFKNIIFSKRINECSILHKCLYIMGCMQTDKKGRARIEIS